MKFLQILAATSSLLFSIAAASPAAHPRLRRSKLPAVKDSYIVVLKDTAPKEASLQRLESLVLPFGSESVKEVGKKWSVINGYSARLSGKALQHVLNDPDVDYVEENSVVKLDTSKFVLSNAVASTQNEIEARAEGGAGTDIIVIDTGIRTTHNSFGTRAIWGAVFGGYPQADGNGHGTAVASVAAGSGLGPATQARVIAVKVLADDGSGTLDDVVSGVDYAVSSFQSTSRPTIAILAIAFAGTGSTAFDSVVRNAIANGIHFVVAAGGQNIDAGATTPSRVAEAVTVGAINSSRAKASTSSFGSVLDVWFLGVNVRAAWNTGNAVIVSASATSLSAAGVAGILSVAIGRYGNKTPALLQADLKTNARPDVTGAPTGTTNLRAVVW